MSARCRSLLVLAALLAAPGTVAAGRRPALSITRTRSVVFSAGDCDTTGECYPFFRIP